ncbi:unnamed protein product, partial [Cyprideis torosa]
MDVHKVNVNFLFTTSDPHSASSSSRLPILTQLLPLHDFRSSLSFFLFREGQASLQELKASRKRTQEYEVPRETPKKEILRNHQ